MKKLVVVLGAGVLVAGIAAANLWQDLRDEREQNRQLAAQAAAMPVPGPPQVPVPPSPPPESVAPPSAALTAAAPTTARSEPEPPAPPPAASASQAQGADANPLATALANPQTTEFVRSMMSSMMAQMYPDLAEELDLSPEEAQKFLALLASHQGELGVESLQLMTGGMNNPAAMQDLQRQLAEQQRANEAEVARTLGSRYPRWQVYQATAAARQQVNQLSTALSAAGRPLSESKTQALVAAFAREQEQVQKEERDWSGSDAALNSPNMIAESLQRAAESQRRTIDIAAPHLDAEQLALYRRQVEQTINMAGAVMGLMGGGGGAPGQAGGAPGGSR
jgi:hypothetical protein